MSAPMLSRSLQPPRRSDAQLIADAEYAERQQQARESAMADVLTGVGDFWPADGEVTAHWDAEQEIPIIAACRDALRNSALTKAQRWELVMDAILEEGARYAEHKAERARSERAR